MSILLTVLVLLMVDQSLSRPPPWYDGVGRLPPDTLECQVGDIAFLIDSSSSIWPEDYVKGNNFLQNLAGRFKIGPNNVRFAAASFGDRVYSEDAFGFDRYLTNQELLTAIKGIPHRGGPRTETGLGIKYVRDNLLPNARPDLPKIVIVITDGQSQKKHYTAAEARRTKQDGVIMFAIGVSHNSSMEELRNIATKDEYVFWVKDFTALTGIEDTLENFLDSIVCEDKEDYKQICSEPTDVYYVFDGAFSGGLFIQEATRFINASVQQMIVHRGEFQIGVISSDCAGVDSFPLNRYRSLTEVQSHINFHVQSSVDALVDEMRNYGYSSSSGGRANAKKVGVIFVDSKVPLSSLKYQTDEAKRQGIAIYIVGVDRADNSYIRELASSPDSQYFLAHTGANMQSLGEEFILRLCGQQTIQPRATLPPRYDTYRPYQPRTQPRTDYRSPYGRSRLTSAG